MEKNEVNGAAGQGLPLPSRAELPGALDLGHLNLPAELSTQEAAKVLGCCKHTVLQFQEEGLLEWRNAAPPSRQRPVFRFTLRSVLELRLAYQRGSPRPPGSFKPRQCHRRSALAKTYQLKHVRRKMPPANGSGSGDERKHN
jgi:hypothetical protein